MANTKPSREIIEVVQRANAFINQAEPAAHKLLRQESAEIETSDTMDIERRKRLARELSFATGAFVIPGDNSLLSDEEMRDATLMRRLIASQIGADRLDDNEFFTSAALARVAGRAPLAKGATDTIHQHRNGAGNIPRERYSEAMSMITSFVGDLKSLIEQFDTEFGAREGSEQTLLFMILASAPRGSVDIENLKRYLKGARHEYITERMLETIPEFQVVHDLEKEGLSISREEIDRRLHSDIIIKYQGELYGIDVKASPASESAGNANATITKAPQNRLWSGISESEFRGNLIPLAPGTRSTHESVEAYAKSTDLKSRVIHMIQSGNAIRIPHTKITAN